MRGRLRTVLLLDAAAIAAVAALGAAALGIPLLLPRAATVPALLASAGVAGRSFIVSPPRPEGAGAWSQATALQASRTACRRP